MNSPKHQRPNDIETKVDAINDKTRVIVNNMVSRTEFKRELESIHEKLDLILNKCAPGHNDQDKPFAFGEPATGDEALTDTSAKEI